MFKLATLCVLSFAAVVSANFLEEDVFRLL